MKMRASAVKARFRLQTSTGTFPKEQRADVSNKLNVNQEYMQALRTKSYTDIWTKVHGETGRSDEEQQQIPAVFPLHPPPNLSSNLLEPRQEILMAVGHDSHLHTLLLDYFERSVEAFDICRTLLGRINQTRSNYRIIQKILKGVKRVSGDYTEEQCRFISTELASFAKLENPLSGSSLVQFGQVHDLYNKLHGQLTSTRRKITRRVKIVRFVKTASGITLLIVFGALNITLMAVAAHTIVGLASIPIFICQSTAFLKRGLSSENKLRERSLVRVGAQLEAAAKGAYILDRDLETMSRLVRRLHDEVEHSKAMIKICLRSPKGHLLREVVKEFESSECIFVDQLKELEEHVYLCFLTINRARKLVVQELSFKQRNTLNGTPDPS
ncbi:UPF0496 protein At1g20180-like [Aristolochia californica]|uniref:UPF0496 protein At1g20180-like n=1 Tax=Aristolochia californica TaxID=171875 RepID=UPI0035DBF149